MAVTIFGDARLVKNEMNVLAADAVVEIAVMSVKDDMLPGAEILCGATYAVSGDLLAFLRRYREEVETT